MAYRHKNFDELVAKEMEDFDFAQSYLLMQIEEHGETLQDALISAIEATGLTKFSSDNGFSLQAVSDFVNRRREYKLAVIAKYLKPFGLKIKLDVEKVA